MDQVGNIDRTTVSGEVQKAWLERKEKYPQLRAKGAL